VVTVFAVRVRYSGTLSAGQVARVVVDAAVVVPDIAAVTVVADGVA
jgi:hypothetical protein